jgi:type III pantothenate kinase
MLLTIDVGNTQIAAGLFLRDQLQTQWRLSSRHERTEDESWILMEGIARANGFEISEASGVAITSVVPDIRHTFEKMAQKYLKCDPVVVNSELDLGIKINYENPKAVGADRLCNAVGGVHKYDGPLIIVDFGTSTTFDVISEKEEYLGGVIAPGIEMSSMILHKRAAKLPRVYLSFPPKTIGTTTETSIQSGLMYGTVEMVEGFTKRIQDELGKKTTNIATGGLARLVLGELRTAYILEPYLTLEGLRIIHQRVKSS